MKALAPAAIILLIAALLSVASFYLRPNVFPWDPAERELDLEAALALEDPLWVDARLEDEYARSHYPDAVLLNEENWEEGFLPLLEVWTPERPIIVYCSSKSCLRSHYVAERLRHDLDTEQIFSLSGGWETLLEAGLVAEEG